jgi:hypothetical protein
VESFDWSSFQVAMVASGLAVAGIAGTNSASIRGVFLLFLVLSLAGFAVTVQSRAQPRSR